ncbi:hypothetical protein [Cyanobium sp. Morenito 9A2]|uniref:hypothetical protein n=1 Tax=Cyanobium sp. Morenito 9A2 TaxID=2823718 RepID=UPI0020CC855A|nr:hypothetical protein [Cyanobium sp. Morenito 9A2]MCP9850552.1 hypothetical protein [Cyanobium sp. Morenito 9A2]
MIPPQLVAAAADVCFKPLRHAVVPQHPAAAELPHDPETDDWALLLQARDGEGCRKPEQDIELEIYRSGDGHNLMLSRVEPEGEPLLWHGGHPVWMDSSNGQRCPRPVGGEALEALARRLHALL